MRIAAESYGLPVGIALAGAACVCHQAAGSGAAVRSRSPSVGAHLCPGAGYVGAGQTAGKRGYLSAPSLPGREERREREGNPGSKARRRAVPDFQLAVCHSWLNRFRKLPVRYEKKTRTCRGLAEFAYAIMIRRNPVPVHPGLVPR